MNNSGTQGFCPRRIGEIFVPGIPLLELSSFTHTDVTCHGGSDGSVTLSTSGGGYPSVNFLLRNFTTSETMSAVSDAPNAFTTFVNLAPGNYQLTTWDNCTPVVNRDFIITQPVRIAEAEFEKVDATCIDPGNGRLKWKVRRSSGSFDHQTSPVTQFTLFKDGQVFDFIETADQIYSRDDLPAGNDYSIMAVEYGASPCNGIIHQFGISSPDPIGMTGLTVTDVSCFDGNNGSISVKGTGRSSYRYSITGNDGTTFANATGIFAALHADSYSLVISNVPGCNDVFRKHKEIVVAQPPALRVSISKTDITCYDAKDGTLASVVMGGTGSFVNTWETQISSVWAPMNKTGNAISNLHAGTYRVRVNDTGLCEATSNDIMITEPDRLTFTKVVVNDIVCYGDKGTLTAAAGGGNYPYEFYYSKNDQSYFPFTYTTLFDAGTYKVKVKDHKGCEVFYDEEQVISTPPLPLTFTATLSDYNGFNISCFGGNNGTALITAVGGNGREYEGYHVRLDSGAVHPTQAFSGITAGTHTFAVTDGRGCEVSKAVNFSQATERLNTQLIEKADVICYGDASGALEVKASEG
jgi:hypothetical protein